MFNKLFTVVVAGAVLSSGVSAQFPQIDQPEDSLLSLRAELAGQAFQEEITVPGSDGLVPVNTTGAGVFEFEGHVLTVADGYSGTGPAILYAPSEADDPAFRAAIAAATGGTVDYFDTRASTPSVATLSQYDAVHVWANFAFADAIGLGDNLAAYNDAGGTVVLGAFCTFTSGNSLGGAIMGPAYCPVVSPTGTNHFSTSSYVGDGTTCIYNGVASLTVQFRDVLVTQGTGVQDGSYADGEICHAYRDGGGADVIYSNGSGASALSPSGDWAQAVGNACTCGAGGPPVWVDQGSALGGVNGDPVLAGSGSLAPTSLATLDLSNAAANAGSALVISNTSTPTPFKGGVFLPGAALVSFEMDTDGLGGWSFSFRAPNAPSGATLWAQVAIVDGAGPQGFSLSNAVTGTFP